MDLPRGDVADLGIIEGEEGDASGRGEDVGHPPSDAGEEVAPQRRHTCGSHARPRPRPLPQPGALAVFQAVPALIGMVREIHLHAFYLHLS